VTDQSLIPFLSGSASQTRTKIEVGLGAGERIHSRKRNEYVRLTVPVASETQPPIAMMICRKVKRPSRLDCAL
jgi:hypothetical protein